MAKSIGIDLGTTNSVVAFKDVSLKVIQTGPNNEELCRSCVAVDKSGSFVVGNAPYKSWKKYAPNIVVSVKRLMGAAISDPQVQRMKNDHDMYPYGITKCSGGTEDSVAIILNGKEYTPEEISAEILRQLKNDASIKLADEVTHAVITVPAYFNEKQKTATRMAAEKAGLKVQRLLAEPTAAAISYGADKMSADEDKIFLVYDFGGGTFDLSILVASGGKFIESGTGGDRWLGGDDIDRILTEYVFSEAGKENNVDIHEAIENLTEKKRVAFQGEIKTEIENAKKALSQVESATVSVFDYLETEDGDPIDIEVCISRSKFEDMIRPLVQRTIDLIDELLIKTAYPIETIDNILLVGGSSCIPLVRSMLCDKYGKDKILSSEKPMLAIAEGAAILSHSLGTESECPFCGKTIPLDAEECPHCHNSLTEVDNVAKEDEKVLTTTKHKYFIEVADDADNIDYREIIDDNIPLPHEANQTFHTLVENQKIVEVKIFSDAENGLKEKIGTGFFTIQENLPVHSELQFSFRLSVDETMNIKVRVPATGKNHNIVIGRGRLDEHCMSTVSSSFDKVMGDPNIPDSKKTAFMGKLQKTIEELSTCGYAPENKGWQKFEDDMSKAVIEATTKDEDNNSIQIAFANILLEAFGRFITEEDKQAMRAEIEKAQSKSPIVKSEALQKLDKLTEDYGLFIHGFFFNIVGHDDSDPVKANKALVVFNQFMSAINENNFAKGRDILEANDNLIQGAAQKINIGQTTHIGG